MKAFFARSKSPISLIALLIIFSVVVGVGCKKKPPEVATPSDPPEVDTSSTPDDTEDVSDTRPMPTVREENTTPAQSMTADRANRQGLLKTVYFDFDAYTIRPDQRATLQENARQLNGPLSSLSVLIEGHCDERGTNEYNMALGDRRANAARDYLISLGVSPNRIRTISYGEERPANSGHNETAWAQNRRSDFVAEGG